MEVSQALKTQDEAIAMKSRFAEVAPSVRSPLRPPQRWYHFDFASVDKALEYLNTNPIQSAGEVAATVRNNGSVSMLTIFPPTAPLQAPQRWFYRNFSDPGSAVTYLNEPPAQSDGEVSATLRGDNTVGVIYIAPA